MPFVLFGALAVFAAGCQTVRLPQGPDRNQFQPIAGAPVVAANVVDSRGSDKMGNIGATTVKAKRTETALTAENYLNQFLHYQQVNAVPVPKLDASQHVSVSQVIQSVAADGAVLFEIHSLSVKSFDLLLSPPKYELKGSFYLFSKEGKPIFHEDLTARTNTQSVTTKGQGEAVAQMINDSLWSLEQNPRFKQQLATLRS
jgi:hypothetical protein